MMMQAAAGPGAIVPIDLGDRRRPMSRWAWLAIGASVLAHVGIGVALYHQRFEVAQPEPLPEGPVIHVETYRRPPPPTPTVVSETPPAPNAPIHQTPLPTQPVETLAAVPIDGPVALDATVVTLTRPVEEPTVGLVTNEPVVTPPGPPVIVNPRWISKPTGDQLMRAYPTRALERGITGSATLSCRVRVNGSISDCSVVSETPGGQGFGRAAVQLSRYFAISPRTEDGRVVDGARVNVGVRFTLPEQ